MKNHKLKKHTKTEQYAAIAHIVMHGAKQKRKDGSVKTVPVLKTDQSEHQVLAECMSWLRRRNIIADRNNVGMFETGSGPRRFGIKDAGDIIGLLPSGKHLEIECKRGSGGRLSVEQQKRQQRIIESRGIYLVIHSVAELESMIEPLLPKDDLFGK